jgi:hypothetical protein
MTDPDEQELRPVTAARVGIVRKGLERNDDRREKR